MFPRISLRPVALLLLLFFGCNRPVENRRVEIPLWKEFAYAEQSSQKVFGAVRLVIEGKQKPTLIQTGKGTLSFSFQLEQQPSLSFSLQMIGRKSSTAKAQIIVESEYPKAIRRQYIVKAGFTQSIDLKEWTNQIVRIRLGDASSDFSAGQRWLWIDPILTDSKPNPKPLSATVQDFRNRHANDNVMIALFDAARASALSCYGYYRSTTPAMDSVAREGVLFENAVSMIPSTRPSVCSMLTGLYPSVHNVMQASHRLPDSIVTLPELFRQKGYITALFSGNPHASLGYDDAFQTLMPDRHRLSEADELAEMINSWLEEVHDRQFFTYIHFREPHAPYKPPRKYRNLFPEALIQNSSRTAVEARYAANLAFADDQFGKVLTQLRRLKLLDRTIIIVLADHGEAFDEHGMRGHIRQVYEEMIRIPLILRFPGESALRGARRNKMVGTIDLMPTFVDLFDSSRKGVIVNGTSLLPYILNQSQAPDRLMLSICEGDRTAYALRSQFFKYIQYKRAAEIPPEFYSLRDDPAEKKNVIDQYPVLASYYRAELQRKFDELHRMTGQIPSQGSEIVLDQETKESLRALGYVY